MHHRLNNIFSRLMKIGAIERQSIVSFISQIGLTLIGFLSTIYFAHAVGASILGAYFLFMAYISIVSLVTDGGFGGAAIKRISEGDEQNEYFSAFVILRSVFVTLIVMVLIVFRSYFVELNNSKIFIWFLAAMIVSLFQGAVLSGIQGCGKVGISSIANFIDNVTRIIVQVVAIFLGFGIAGLAGGFVVGMLAGALIQMHFFDLHIVSFKWDHIKNLSNFSLWIFLISGGGIVFSSADTVMIGYYLGNADIGVYRIVGQFASLAVFTTNALRGALYPKVSRWGKIGDIGLIENSLSRAFTYSLILAIPMLAGGILLGDKLLYYFYGADFGRGYATLFVLFLVQIVNIFQFFFSTYLIALGHLKDLFKITVIAVVANIGLNVVLIPVIGIIGAAFATLVAMGFNAILAQRVLSKNITVRVESNNVLNIIKAAAAMSLLVGIYRLLIPISNIWMVLIPVVLGGAIYVVIILKFSHEIYDELKGIMKQMNII